MTIDSNKVIVLSEPNTISSFLSDAQNIIHLLPQDKISDFKADESQCSFKVQGGITISLIQNGLEEGSKVFMKSGEKSPFPFTLTIHISEHVDGAEGYIHFEGEINAFMKMMVEKPLTNLFNYMSKKLQEYYT